MNANDGSSKFISKRFVISLFAIVFGSFVFAPLAHSGVFLQGRDPKLWQEALRIHRAAIVIDGHNDIAMDMTDKQVDLTKDATGKRQSDIPRWKRGGLNAQFFSIWTDPRKLSQSDCPKRARAMIASVYREVKHDPKDLILVTTADEIRQAKRDGKIAALMGVEGGHNIDDSLDILREYHRLGVRYMTLTWMNTNNWADSGGPASPHLPGPLVRHHGLTAFGKQVVREMNRLGMLVDISHTSDETVRDALAVSKVPVIASHSSARALANVPRNIPDDLLQDIAKNGGVVMVNFESGYLDERIWRAKRANPESALAKSRSTVERLVDHIEHIIEVAGIDHVGLGSDFDGDITPPRGLEDVSKYPAITYELLKRGHSEADIRKVLGENILRVMEAAESYAKLHQKTARSSKLSISRSSVASISRR